MAMQGLLTTERGRALSEVRFDRERLTALMKEKKIGDTALARRVGVSRTMIFYLKNGKRGTASAEVIKKIAEELGTTVDYLLGDDEGREAQNQPPETIRQLNEIATKLSEARQEELVRIADALKKMEAEEIYPPIRADKMIRVLRAARDLPRDEQTDKLVEALGAILGQVNGPRRWLIDLGDTPEHGPENPTEGE